MDFGFVATPADAPGTSDRALIEGVMRTCSHNRDLGFTDAWVLEHHFSDWYPSPDPVMLMAHLAAAFPDLSLGTAVIVTPWHNPIRLAEQIALLTMLTDQPISLGLGRGSAPLEYDAFGLDLEESRGRFDEMFEIVETALTGRPFTYDGTFYEIPREVRIRPEADVSKIQFYGAVSNEASAEKMGELGAFPMFALVGRAQFEQQGTLVERWKEVAAARGIDVSRARISVLGGCIIADTDAEAIEQAQEVLPRFMQAQVDHYETDTTPWEKIKSYESWKRGFAGIRALTDPANIPEWSKGQLIGSADTIAERIRRMAGAGFNYVLLRFPNVGTPIDMQLRWTQRFAHEVAPRFSPAFAERSTAANA